MNSITDLSESTGITLSSIEEVIEEAKAGRIFILVDDENRENEGDLCIPAETLPLRQLTLWRSMLEV